MEDFEMLVKQLRICYQKAQTKEEIKAIHRFILGVSQIERESAENTLELVESIYNLKVFKEGK